jgi:predicted enzyme related to lactoylglutathione lyase
MTPQPAAKGVSQQLTEEALTLAAGVLLLPWFPDRGWLLPAIRIRANRPELLGFRRDFGDGSDGWCFLSRDAFKIMLGECAGEKPASELGDHSYVAYLIVEGVDQFHAEVAERGAEVWSPPATEPWGLREFSIRTPDGHRIRFGEPTGVTG